MRDPDKCFMNIPLVNRERKTLTEVVSDILYSDNTGKKVTTQIADNREKAYMEKVIQIVRTEEARSDVTYWKTQSHEQRLATLESIRQEYIAWKYEHQPRFQRVYRIIKHA